MVRGLGARGGGRHVVDGGDGGGEVGRWSEGQGFGGEDGAHCGGCGEEVVMLRCRGLGIAVHELLADVCAIFERHCLYVVVVVFTHGTMVAGFSQGFGTRGRVLVARIWVRECWVPDPFKSRDGTYIWVGSLFFVEVHVIHTLFVLCTYSTVS